MSTVSFDIPDIAYATAQQYATGLGFASPEEWASVLLQGMCEEIARRKATDDAGAVAVDTVRTSFAVAVTAVPTGSTVTG